MVAQKNVTIRNAREQGKVSPPEIALFGVGKNCLEK